MRNIMMAAAIFSVALGLFSCNSNIATPVHNYTSARYGIEVNLPDGWAAADGPTMVATKSIDGLVAFNSWGQKDFWAKEKDERNPDGLGSLVYNDGTIVAQIPAGGVYVAMVEISGPPPPPDNLPPEYTRDDLSGLYKEHDWRQDYVYFKSFYKDGTSLSLTVACSHNATNETVAQINDLLKSWKFVNFSIE